MVNLKSFSNTSQGMSDLCRFQEKGFGVAQVGFGDPKVGVGVTVDLKRGATDDTL
jgi:hypothetical protein